MKKASQIDLPNARKWYSIVNETEIYQDKDWLSVEVDKIWDTTPDLSSQEEATANTAKESLKAVTSTLQGLAPWLLLKNDQLMVNGVHRTSRPVDQEGSLTPRVEIWPLTTYIQVILPSEKRIA